MEKSRVFISIELPGQIKDALRAIQNPEIRWIKWMKPGNFHITLSFLGDVVPDQIQSAFHTLKEVAVYYRPFDLTLDRTSSEQDMLWVVPREESQLFDFQDELQKRLRQERLVKRERRKFSPHILLAKSKTGRPMTWQPENFEPLSFTVTEIGIYKSDLTPGAATHTRLLTANLGEV